MYSSYLIELYRVVDTRYTKQRGHNPQNRYQKWLIAENCQNQSPVECSGNQLPELTSGMARAADP